MRMLELFCGEGVGGQGYWQSGRFHEIVGVDINSKMSSSYSFNFLCADALTLDYDFLMSFDFIHASPPCQAYSKMTPKWARGRHKRLIPNVRLMLEAAGKPFVIENVSGAMSALRPNLIMNGGYFGLPMDRVRLFYVSTLAKRLVLIRGAINPVQIHGGTSSRADLVRAFGLDKISTRAAANLTMGGIEQGIPPVMTAKIAELMFPDYKAMIG